MWPLKQPGRGREFAVVADEVRKLAEKTMEATKKVATNIQGFQKSIKENVKISHKTNSCVSNANVYVS